MRFLSEITIKVTFPKTAALLTRSDNDGWSLEYSMAAYCELQQPCRYFKQEWLRCTCRPIDPAIG